MRKAWNRKWPIAAVAAIFALSVIGVLWWNMKLYTPSKQAVRAELQHAVREIKFPGRLVVNRIDDNGCVATDVMLVTYYDCSLRARKYFVSSNGTVADIRAADRQLISLGWLRAGGVSAIDEELYQSFAIGRNAVSYYGDNLPSLYISHYSYDDLKNDKSGDVQELRSIELNRDEHVYGVVATSVYWSCKQGIVQLPCPAPPTPPRDN